MGIMSWFTDLFTESPPEPLVLGAELKCPWGTSHSYLYVDSDNIDINNLPQAHVEDCIAFYNIAPFGKCIYKLGQPCEFFLCPADQWENSEPQNVVVNEKEIITTKSTLICRTSGSEIKAVTTGQDAIYAKELILYKEMIENYPGLLVILLDPYGSLYLNGEMYETAFKFLDDCLARHGGELSYEFIFGGVEPEGKMIRAILERLNPGSQKDPIANNTTYLLQLGMNITSFESVKAESRARAEEIRTNPVKRWIEGNQKFISELEDDLTQALCAVLLCSSVVTTTPIEGPSFGLVPQTGIGGAGVPATIDPNIYNEYYIIGAIPGPVQPQLPSVGGTISGGTQYIGCGKTSLSDLPESVQNSFKRYDEAGWQGNVSGQTPGTNAGRKWMNRDAQLPTTDAEGNQITYREFDVNNYNGVNRDAERFIVGSDESVWYTDSHYGDAESLNGIEIFLQIK